MANNYVFTNASGYNRYTDLLKGEVLSIADDNATQIFVSTSIFDYAINVNDIQSQDNFPLFIISESTETMNDDDIMNSTLIFTCYIVFNCDDTAFTTTFNQIIATMRQVFLEDFNNRFRIININRSSGLPRQLGGSAKYAPFWVCKLTITTNSVLY